MDEDKVELPSVPDNEIPVEGRGMIFIYQFINFLIIFHFEIKTVSERKKEKKEKMDRIMVEA